MKYLVCSIAISGLFAVLFVVFFSQNAYAYLDPGSGSFILQVAIAAIVGGVFVIKLYFNKIKVFFKKLLSKDGNDNEQPDG
jgi:hypothetical protein